MNHLCYEYVLHPILSTQQVSFPTWQGMYMVTSKSLLALHEALSLSSSDKCCRYALHLMDGSIVEIMDALKQGSTNCLGYSSKSITI